MCVKIKIYMNKKTMYTKKQFNFNSIKIIVNDKKKFSLQ